MMRDVFTSRAFRCIVCLILVCCLLVSWSPIRAEASALPEVAGVVTKVIPLNPSAGAAAGGAALGTQVFGYVLGGLGLIVTTAQVIDLMNRYMEFTGELETSIYYYPDGSWSYGVDMSFIERVRAFLFDDGILLYESVDLTGLSDYQLRKYGSITSSYDYCYTWIRDGNIHFAYDTHPIDLVYNSSFSKWILRDEFYKQGGTFYHTYLTATGQSVVQNYDTYSLTEHPVACGALNKSVVATDDFILGEVAPLEVPMPAAYPEWHTNARPTVLPNTDKEITVLPIPINPNNDTGELPDDVTQEDIWPGSVADPLPDLDTNPDTGTDTDPDSGSSGDAPSSNIADYTIDLTQFFPFCIPFDLYDFFTCLNADPVAPVIEWAIPMPGGEMYPLEIDLSVFDPVAQLLRRLELLLFCVGLAFKTRDLIKG